VNWFDAGLFGGGFITGVATVFATMFLVLKRAMSNPSFAQFLVKRSMKQMMRGSEKK
jgi:hypothetical protein